MFHALSGDSKQQADTAKTNPLPQQQNAYPAFDGSHALGMPPLRDGGLPPLRGGGLPPPAAVSPRKLQMARLQQAYGNQAVLRMLERSRPAIQPKLVVNQPGDAFEQEADRVADQVMRMPAPDLPSRPRRRRSAANAPPARRRRRSCKPSRPARPKQPPARRL